MSSSFAGESASLDREWTSEDTDDVRKMTRWTDLVSAHMTEMQVRSDCPSRFASRWRQFALGPVTLNFIDATPHHCLRSRQMLSRHSEPTFELLYMKDSAMTVHYEGEAELVPAGGFALLRNCEPYEFRCDGPTTALSVHLNEAWLRGWLVRHERFSTIPQEKRRLLGAPLAALLETISDNGVDSLALPRQTLADQIGALIAFMDNYEGPATTSHQRSLLNRIRSMMRDSLSEIDLNPETLARRAGISKRYLHRLLAAEGVTFGGLLIEMRLARAKQLLEAPRSGGCTIAEISFSCGFADQSHFARCFRRRYGATPTKHRALLPGQDTAKHKPRRGRGDQKNQLSKSATAFTM